MTLDLLYQGPIDSYWWTNKLRWHGGINIDEYVVSPHLWLMYCHHGIPCKNIGLSILSSSLTVSLPFFWWMLLENQQDRLFAVYWLFQRCKYPMIYSIIAARLGIVQKTLLGKGEGFWFWSVKSGPQLPHSYHLTTRILVLKFVNKRVFFKEIQDSHFPRKRGYFGTHLLWELLEIGEKRVNFDVQYFTVKKGVHLGWQISVLSWKRVVLSWKVFVLLQKRGSFSNWRTWMGTTFFQWVREPGSGRPLAFGDRQNLGFPSEAWHNLDTSLYHYIYIPLRWFDFSCMVEIEVDNVYN